MQKLEEVLRAEEAARHAVSDARERAATLVHDAEATSKRSVAESRDAATLKAERIREDSMSLALKQADGIESDSKSALEETERAARERIPQAASAALNELLS